MRTITFKKKEYPILLVKVWHKEYYPNGEWLKIAKESLSLELAKNDYCGDEKQIDEEIYFYLSDDFDFTKIKVGDIIELDELFEVMDLEV